jgi:hypothetical protein
MSLPSKEDARLCAAVIKEIAASRGVARDAFAIGKLTTSVAKLYSKGIRDHAQLLSAALESFDAISSAAQQTISSHSAACPDPRRE